MPIIMKYLVEICQKPSENLLNTCQNIHKTQVYKCIKAVRNLTKFEQNMLKMCREYSQNMPEIFSKYAQKLYKIQHNKSLDKVGYYSDPKIMQQ